MLKLIVIIGWIVVVVAVVALAMAVLDLGSFLTIKQSIVAGIVGLAIAVGIPAVAGDSYPRA